MKLYSVWDNHTDELVALDETAARCAWLMDIKPTSFRRILCRFEHGLPTKWHIERTVKK